jgi:hypothetical protein
MDTGYDIVTWKQASERYRELPISVKSGFKVTFKPQRLDSTLDAIAEQPDYTPFILHCILHSYQSLRRTPTNQIIVIMSEVCIPHAPRTLESELTRSRQHQHIITRSK